MGCFKNEDNNYYIEKHFKFKNFVESENLF